MLLDVAREPEERRSAAIGLGGLKDDRAVDALLEALYDSDVSGYACSALKELRTPKAQSLLPVAEVLATLENEFSREAVEAAAKLGDARVVRSFVHCLERGLPMLDLPIREWGDAERRENIRAIVRRIIGILGAFDTVEARAALDKYSSFQLSTK